MTAPPAPQITLRPVTDADVTFLARLYASTRQEELAAVAWTDQAKAEFLAQQFHAQHSYYAQQFSAAQFSIVLIDGVAAGRLYVDRRATEFRIIDIALLPAYRGQGVGTRLLCEVGAEAAGRGLAVTIHVEQFNPARRLYQRLGFVAVADEGVYELLRWQPQSQSQTQTQANTAS